MELLDWIVVIVPPVLGALVTTAAVEVWERWRYR